MCALHDAPLASRCGAAAGAAPPPPHTQASTLPSETTTHHPGGGTGEPEPGGQGVGVSDRLGLKERRLRPAEAKYSNPAVVYFGIISYFSFIVSQ